MSRPREARRAVLALALGALAIAACQKQSDLRAQDPNGLSLTSGTFDAPPPRATAPAPIDDEAASTGRGDAAPPPP